MAFLSDPATAAWTGTTTLTWEARAGAAGFEGVTLHADIDGDGRIDASVTWAATDAARLPTPVVFEDLIWFL